MGSNPGWLEVIIKVLCLLLPVEIGSHPWWLEMIITVRKGGKKYD